MFLDISNEEYHKRPGVSASMLKSMAIALCRVSESLGRLVGK